MALMQNYLVMLFRATQQFLYHSQESTYLLCISMWIFVLFQKEVNLKKAGNSSDKRNSQSGSDCCSSAQLLLKKMWTFHPCSLLVF